MKLGRACQITIGTANVKESYEFYRCIGFRKIAEDSSPFPWIKVTDDSIVILLYQNGDSYIGLTYFDAEMDKTVEHLTSMGIRFVQRGPKENIFITGTDTIVILVHADHESMFALQNKMLLDLPESDYHISERYPNEMLGIFGEFSITVDDLQEAISLWEPLGFKLHHRTEWPYPWALMYDGQMIIGLHETQSFDGPVLSYFGPEIKQRVSKLSDLAVYASQIDLQGDDNGNYVIHTPESQKIFLVSAQV